VWRYCPGSDSSQVCGINSFAMHILYYRKHVLMPSEKWDQPVHNYVCRAMDESLKWQLWWVHSFLTSFQCCGSGIRYLVDPWSGMNIPDLISGSLETIFWVKNTKIPWCGFRSEIRNLLDPASGMEKFGSGIRGKHPRSATLLFSCLIEHEFVVILGWLIYYPWPFRIRVLKKAS
jgi:hypothetical protein